MKNILLILFVISAGAMLTSCGSKVEKDWTASSEEETAEATPLKDDARHPEEPRMTRPIPQEMRGNWGIDSETGNAILYVPDEGDSLLWVDPLLWCRVEIVGDSIRMLYLEDGAPYFQARFELSDDTLTLIDEDHVFRYGRNR